jgi:xanthine dehydrogenase accessory factor
VAGEEWFLHVFAPRPRLVIVGAVHIARALIGFARQVGFETIVIDPRTAFTQEARFDPQPDAMVAKWPQEAFESVALGPDSYVVALTHDPKIDDDALAIVLRSDAAYVGALGSRTTQGKRRAALLERGLTDGQIDRIHGPIGLDIGAENPEEIALAIIAEVVKVRRARC